MGGTFTFKNRHCSKHDPIPFFAQITPNIRHLYVHSVAVLQFQFQSSQPSEPRRREGKSQGFGENSRPESVAHREGKAGREPALLEKDQQEAHVTNPQQ